MNTRKVVDEVSVSEFKRKLKLKPHQVSQHALDHISSNQRGIYSEDVLLKILNENNPRKIGVQRNGHLRVLYRRENDFFEMILAEKTNRFEIITFINLKNPRKVVGVKI